MASPCSYEERVVANLFSFFLSAWNMKGSEEGGMMMMFIRMGVVLLGIMRG